MSVSAGANPPSANSANTGPDTCTSDAPDSSDAPYAANSSDTAYAANSSDASSNAGSNATYAGSDASGDATGNGERNAAGRDSANQQTFHYDSHMYLRRTSPVRKRCREINVPRCRMRFHRKFVVARSLRKIEFALRCYVLKLSLYANAEGVENASRGALVREDAILETQDLTKEFAGFVAVRGVNLRVQRGTIHALIGPNGAGKTTCFNLLTKFLSPTRGRIVFGGRDITALKPADVARLGVGRSFQISAVFPHLTVRENVRVALQRRRGNSFDFWRSKRVLHALDDRAMALIGDVGLGSYADRLAVELPYGRKRALEIATTLALEPELLLLDEPTAGMGREDIERISALIRSVGAERTVLMVEHNLSVVADLCDRITVLTRGQVLAEGDYETVAADPAVREAYLGTGHA